MNPRWHEFKDGWRVVIAASFGVGVGMIGAPIMALGTFFQPLETTFGWTRGQVSLASLCMVAGAILTAPMLGRAADKIGVRKLGLISLFLLGLGLLAMTQITSNIYTFYAGLLVLSLVGCGTTPTTWTRGVSTWFDQKRGTALGITLAGTGVAAMMVPVFIGGLIAKHDWRAGYLGLAGLAFAAIIPVYFWFTEAGRGSEAGTHVSAVKAGMETRQALKTRQFWQLAIGNCLVTAGTASAISHMVPLLSGKGGIGIERPAALAIAGLMGFAIILGRLFMGLLVDKFHAPYVAAAFILGPCIACLILVGDTSHSMLMIQIAALLLGLAAGSEVQVMSYLVGRFFGLKAYGEIYGWQFIFFELAVGFGPLIVGQAFDANGSYDTSLYGGAVVFVVAALAIGTLGKPPRFEEAK